MFAKAAAKIDSGKFEKLGEKIKEIQKLQLYQNGREGMVVRIDGFGNIITNLTKKQKNEYTVEIEGRKYVMQYCPNYYAAKENELFLIEGSNKTLEISIKDGSANDKLHLKTGQKIKIS